MEIVPAAKTEIALSWPTGDEMSGVRNKDWLRTLLRCLRALLEPIFFS